MGKKRIRPIKAETKMVNDVIDYGNSRTAGAIENKDPKRVALILQMRADGCSLREIKRSTGMDFTQISKLCKRHKETIEERRKSMAEHHGFVATAYLEAQVMKAEQLLDDPELLKDICPSRLALTTAIHSDKENMLNGGANVVIEHRKGPSIEDAQKAIADAKARVAAKLASQSVEAEIIEEEC